MNELEVVRTVEAYLHDVKRSKVRDVVDSLYKLYKDKDTKLAKANSEIDFREHLISESSSMQTDLEEKYNSCLSAIHKQNVTIANAEKDLIKLRSVNNHIQEDNIKLRNDISFWKRKVIFYKIAFLAALSVLLATILLLLS